ncbi:polysaccharide biosynthesis tyrosine autokinase [Pedobacter polaris]|uniref:non-specific protein-tyrosine kinase n=1 Tax=Pedobacter polaris TaxID=2571273 RepID=A0A4U1CLS5_9SPHI|nr:tyrosine-protein kinase family protein [Pedobacter polaris]TKC08196.1 polysaccharide biosynthesis tyrosine autokinase [Pedobacter polaris]
MNTQESISSPKSIRQDIDFYKIFKVFLSRWYWIAGCILISLVIAKINLMYTVPSYQTYGELKLQESNPTVNSVAATSQVYNYTDKIQAEGFVIRSNAVILKAIENLDYKVSYYLQGTIRKTELYPSKPFEIEIKQQDSVDFARNEYFVEPVNSTKFLLSASEKGAKTEYSYNQNINLGNMVFSIKSQIPSLGDYSFKFNSKEDFIGRANVNADEAAKYTNVMSLSLVDKNATFATDMLNAIMKEYIANDVIEKRRSARQTIAFIDQQLGFSNKKADTAGSNFASYKVKNKIIDLNATSQNNAGKLIDLEKQKSTLDLELISINQLEDQLRNNHDKTSINLNLEGNLSSSLGGLISQLNSLITIREGKLKELRPNSQPIKELDDQILSLKNSIRMNVNSSKVRNLNTIKYINSQISQINQTINALPPKEKDFLRYQSNFDVSNKVLTYLSERKLESELNAAAIVPGAAIVNLASYATPISSNPNKVYSFSVMMGLAAGVGLILLVRFLNPYIYDKETVESLTSTPIIGVIRKFPDYIDKDSRQALSIAKPKSVFAESVRSVRTNLSFLAANKKSKTICITSEVSGEGKSFVTVNLAGTLALIDKKIILIAADLRRSKLHKVFGSDNKKGLSTFLTGKHRLEEVMMHDDVHNIDFIPSGPVPPNPSELLHTDNMKELLKLLAPKYDYVLVDTAPVGLVSDAIPLIRQSDVNLFVIRSGKSQYRAAAIPERLSKEYGLSNLAIVLNAFGDDALHSNYYTTDYSRGGGNSTYYYSDYSGYAGSGYYDNDPKKWWEFWKKK